MELVSKNNTACVVVSYNPDEENICKLIDYLSNTFLEVCLVDNNSSNYESLRPLLGGYKNVRIIHNDSNKGIASAINIGIKEVFKKNLDWIITFDQDSLPTEYFVSAYNKVLLKEHKIGLLCPGHTNKREKLMDAEDEILYEKSMDLISSGLLHNVEVFDRVGYYNEAMFIDYVDFEYTLRVAQYYDTYKLSNNTLFHIIGDPLEKAILGKKIYSSNHSPLRRYYKSRNLVYVYRLWHDIYPQWTSSKLITHLKSIFPLILLENNKWGKLRSIVRGLYDGINFLR